MLFCFHQVFTQVWNSSTEVCWEVLQGLQPGEWRQWPGGSLSRPELRPLPVQVLPGFRLSAPVLLREFLGEPRLQSSLLSHQVDHQVGPEVSRAVVWRPDPALQTISPPLLRSTHGRLPLPLSHLQPRTRQLSLQDQLCSQHSQRWRRRRRPS